jgi:hypothetical protein
MYSNLIQNVRHLVSHLINKTIVKSSHSFNNDTSRLMKTFVEVMLGLYLKIEFGKDTCGVPDLKVEVEAELFGKFPVNSGLTISNRPDALSIHPIHDYRSRYLPSVNLLPLHVVMDSSVASRRYPTGLERFLGTNYVRDSSKFFWSTHVQSSIR